MKKQFAAPHVIHHQIQFFHRLKCKSQGGNEGVVGFGQHPSLRLGMFYLPLFFYFVFVQHFHRVNLVVRVATYHEHFTKSTFAQHFDQLKIIDPQFGGNSISIVSRLCWRGLIAHEAHT